MSRIPWSDDFVIKRLISKKKNKDEGKKGLIPFIS